MKLKQIFAGLVLTGGVVAMSSVAAQEQAAEEQAPTFGLETAEKINVAQLSCWDLVTLGEDDRGFAMVLLYGFARGQKDAPQFSPRDVQVAVVNTMQECVDKPDAIALDILKSHVQP